MPARTLDTNRRLVESRAQIQRLLLELQQFIADHRRTLLADPLTRSTVFLLTGAAFSLWRASFLTDVRRSPRGALAGAEQFLTIVVRDNAINYSHEKTTQKWTVGFYLNGGALRIDAILRNLANTPGFAGALRGRAFARFEEIVAEGVHTASPARAWDVIHRALSQLVQTILPQIVEQRLSVRRRTRSMSKRGKRA